MHGVKIVRFCLGTALGAVLAAQSAAAQVQSPDDGNQEDRPENVAPPTIIVTGSRIQQAGYTAPTPVTAITTEEMTRTAPSNIPDALNQLPQFSGSISQNHQADTGGSVVRSGNYLDLRALGSQRVLVLLNGRRLPPTSNTGAVDSNLIPQMLVNRVDVVTGGASAAYGSDAVSGVVNYVLDDQFKGLKLNMQSGISNYNDNASYRLGAAFGGSFLDDRMHILVSAERSHSNGIGDRSSRYTSDGLNTESALTIGGFGTEENPYYYVGNAHFGIGSYSGLILSGPLAGQQFNADGSALVPYDPGVPIPGRPGFAVGGDGIVLRSRGLTGIPSLTTNQFFGRAAFDVTSDVTLFAQANYNTGSNKDHNVAFGLPFNGSTIFAENAFLNPAVASLLSPGESFRLGRFYSDAPATDGEQRNKNIVVTAGVEGRFGGTFKWDIYYTNGYSKFDTEIEALDHQKYFAAVDAVRDSSGNIVCNVTITNPGLMDDCVPLNPFGGLPSPAAMDYVYGVSRWGFSNKMDLVAANLSGEAFSLWAGPIAFAIGAEYREQSFEQTSNSDPAVPVSFVGIRGATATSQFAGFNVGTGKGSYTIKEVYGELAVPLARGTVIGDLDANGAVRFTDYSTSGTETTWKVGLSYEPIPDIRFRGTISRDIRAPSLFELFAGRQQTTSPLTDLHTGITGVTNFISGGNADLEPERAKTYTLGVVVSPRVVPGLNFSMDYYDIKIDNAISRPFSAPQIVDLCEQSGGTSELCDFVIRPLPYADTSAANYPTEVRVPSLNLASVRVSGIDFEGSYRTHVGNGTLSARLLASRLIHFQQQNSPLAPKSEFAGNADLIQGFYPLPMPKWRGSLEFAYQNGGFLGSINERYVGRYNISDQFEYENNKRKAVFYTDLHLSYTIDTEWGEPKFFATANNLFNQKGRTFLISNISGLNMPTSRNIYDVIGRYITVGVQIKM